MNEKERFCDMKLRIKFSKQETMKLIGHLDMMRYFQKAIRRAEIDIVYSEGFSPHQIMSFAAPLGVGLTSLAEYFDIEVSSISTTKQMIQQLNQEMVPGICIENIVKLSDNAKNAMASVRAAKYDISFDKPDALSDILQKKDDFYSQESILIEKETKKGINKIDIKPHIFEVKIDSNHIMVTVDASSSGNVKPGSVVDAFTEFFGISKEESCYHIQRVETYTILNEETLELVPLDEVGEVF